ncbi:pre-mRNA-processing protein prp40 [Amanita rubescens]|nr:pre-mRNA-processing protein prp40 [Amanita rubescens]
MWTEHRNPEGRTYWFNTATKQSVWEKPNDLKTPFEKALTETKWREYFSGGRKYYYNTESKESKWDMPDELLLLLEKVEKEKAMAAAAAGTNLITGPEPTGTTQGALAPMGGANQSSSASQSTQQNGLAVGHHTGSLPLAPSSVLPARPNLPDDPVIPHNGFPTIEEAEKAFMHLLRKAGVDANWTWDQTMRAIITDPLYKALNTLAEKKACWEKYTNNLRAKEQEEKEARLAKLRPAVRNMLKGNPNVFHYTTFPTADKLFAQHPIWQQARIESERKMIFDEHVTDLKQREVQESRGVRARSVQKVMALFKQLNVDVVTQEYMLDPELQKLPTLDVLLAFEDYSRVREREYEEQMRRAQVEKTRKERKAREAFRDVVRNLVHEGKIKARSKWKEVYPLFRDDERYISMLGNPGSNPLELFWDAVDALDQQLDRKITIVEEVFKNYGVQEEVVSDKAKSKGFVIGSETTEEEFNKVVKAHADEAVRTLTKEDLYEVYKTLHDTAVKKQADEKRRAERKQRHLQDDLRYAFKKLSDPLDITMSYEQIIPLVEHLSEYKALEDDEGRRAAWAKYVKRQKEKMREAASEDGASTTSRKRKEPHREHRDERERDKEDKGRDREKDRDRERDRDKEKDREYRDRDRERDRDRDRNRDYEREGRSSRHHHRYDELDGHRSSRDYGRERDKDYERDKDREGYRSSRHYRDDDRKRERDGGHRDRKSSHGAGYGRDWDEPPRREERERSASVYDEPREKHEDRHPEERAEKASSICTRARLDQGDESMEAQDRAESPEEGEI